MKHTQNDTPMFTSAGLLLALNLLASALNYVYQIILARLLTVEAFGTVYTIFSLMLVTSVPGSAFTMMASQRIAKYIAQNDYQMVGAYIRDLNRKVSLFSIVVFVAGLALWRPLSQMLKMEDGYVLVLVIFCCALGYYHPMYTGCMSGAGRFLLLGLYALLIPAYKLIGLSAVVLADQTRGKLLGVLWSLIIGSLFTALAGYLLFYKFIKKSKHINSFKLSQDLNLWKESFVVNICLAVYMNIDVFLARKMSGEAVSGLYSAVTMFGKMIYYCAASLGTVLLPTVAAAGEQKSRVILKKTVFVAGTLSAGGLLVLNLAKDPLIRILYGSAYLQAEQYVGYVSLIAFSVALLTVLTNFFVGILKTRHLRNALLFLQAGIAAVYAICRDLKTALLLIGLFGLECSVYLIVQYLVFCKDDLKD